MKLACPVTAFSHLTCSGCHKEYPAAVIQHISPCCKQPLLARYMLDQDLSIHLIQEWQENALASLWRYKGLLPVFEEKNIISLGEGMTPTLRLASLGNQFDLPQLFLKDESLNPTGSFKARGMSVAVSKAKELGVTHCIVPTAGNAGGALAAYCAAAGIKATVVMPQHTPMLFKQECEMYGAELILIDGLINDCARKIASMNQDGGYYDISTMKEPYRLEGKKTMGFEIAEQFNWQLPDVILYPTGGGTGLIGIWKAFTEMQALGWLGKKLPRMIAIQSVNCQPIFETWSGRQLNSKNYQGKASLANGLAVPHPFAESLILQIVKESGGEVISIDDHDMISSLKEVARKEGIFMAPEGGALWAALKKMIRIGKVGREEKILLLNTGSGYKYLENFG